MIIVRFIHSVDCNEDGFKNLQAKAIYCNFNRAIVKIFRSLPVSWKKYIDTSDLVQRVRRYNRTEWFKNQFASWNHQKTVKFSPTSFIGLCYSFNMDSFQNVYKEGYKDELASF
jgi:hypothetical protein